MVEQSGDYAIVCIDPHGVIVSWNAAAQTLLGWRAAEAIGQCADLCFTTEDRAAGRLQAEMRDARDSGVARSERWVAKQDGGRVWAAAQLTALRDNDAVIGYAKILRDRTPERLLEERLRITQSGSAGSFEAFPDTQTVIPSAKFCELWGIAPRPEIPVAELIARMHPDDQQVLAPDAAWDAQALPAYVEYRIRAPGATTFRWLARHGEFDAKDLSGRQRFIGVVTDVTPRRLAQQALLESTARENAAAARFQALTELNSAIFWQANADGVMTYLSPQWYALTGQSPEQALPDGWVDALHPEDRPNPFDAWADARRHGTVYEAERRFRGGDGLDRWYLIRALPQRDARGNVTEWLGCSVDISERKRDEIVRFERERRQGFVLALTDQLRGITAPGDALDMTSRMLGHYLGASLVAYPVVDVAARVAMFEHCWAPPGHATCNGPLTLASLGVTPDVELLRGHTLHFASDQHPLHQDARACSTVIVPLYRSENTKTLLYVTSYGDRQWSRGEIQLIEAVAERTWNAVARIRSEIELEKRVATAIAERDQIWLTSPDMIAVIRANHTVLSINPAVQDVLGWSSECLVGASAQDYIHPDDLETTREHIARLAAGTAPMLRFENRYLDRAGNYRWLSWTAAGAKELVYAFGRDITERKAQTEALRAAEDALRQSQKMEAVGQLTGGVAHDFNNLLQGILSPLELVQRSMQLGRFHDLDRFVSMASASAKRAAALTHRLLAFSRRQPIDPKPTDVNQLVVSMADLVHRTLGESIAVEMVFAPDLWQTRCDPNQLENALLNLAINARDAMPDGGRLSIETVNAHLDHADVARHPDVLPGQYVTVCVSDTGTGMPADVIARAFEPFYTTKPIGKGTGLGLSMVYGFARQSGGTTSISSEMGRGTTLRVYLPRYHGAAIGAPAPALASAPTGPLAGKGTVALVEDDPVVRALVRDALEELGYEVLEAVDGHSGAELVTRPGPIDLLVTDVGLPGLNGRQVAEIARQSRPSLKVLFMTGYAENAARGDGLLDPGMAMITKPFSLAAFAVRIAEMAAQTV
ncbi:MAG: PAS domain S-box protein [Janthinobacterium lividum]